ncbi:MAG: hypothetical protein R3B06_06405 [Kofleriaceae bacterium]
MSLRSLAVTAAVTCGLAATAATVRADCYSDDCRDARERAWAKPRFEGGFGLLAGSYTVATVHGAGVGLHVDGGVRLNRLALLGEYDFLSVGESSYDNPAPVRGVLHRLGANARYSLASFGGRNVPLRGDIWIEGGVGNQLVQWHGGGELSRRDLAFGVGGQMTARIGGDRHPNYLGFYYAFRGLVARDPFPSKDMPTCAGPCDTPTGPSSWDTGAFFNVGLVFSR